jgi:tryptophan synthase alpha chain
LGRITDCFQRLADSGHKALVVYVVAGDPTPEITVPLMHTMVANGATIIEVGVPFTDPEAEGPVIQLAHERAMRHRISLRDTIKMVATFREQDQTTPVVLMGYINPIEAMGYEKFASLAAEAGVDGTILVNVPPEEGLVLDTALLAKGIDPVYLLAPTTPEARARMIFERSRGFTYYVSLKGTTGAGNLDVGEVKGRVAGFKAYATTPVVVGFGIKDGVTAAQVAQVSDGAVVGTAIVSLMAAHEQHPEQLHEAVGELVQEMRTAMDAVS